MSSSYTEGGWGLPEDHPLVQERDVVTDEELFHRESTDIDEIQYWLELKNDSGEFIPEVKKSLTLNNMVRGLIHGGRYLYGWNAGAGGDAPQGEGMPELEPLQECSIDCVITRRRSTGKRGEVHVGLAVPPAQLFMGYEEDADEHETEPAETVGPRQSGPPPDVLLKFGPSFVTMSPREREAQLFEMLCRVQRSITGLRSWIIGGADIEINEATISIYGTETLDGRVAISGSQNHVTPDLVALSKEDRAALYRTLSREFSS